ncbi:hypothetical protein WJX84_007560 [Apatococcus fuscideae]|uniref:Uncharacterized protein n=1 Tax=Apatococcus fuscideae TaxID=2026836 RepID=A0AAW1SSY0_9CHLO
MTAQVCQARDSTFECSHLTTAYRAIDNPAIEHKLNLNAPAGRLLTGGIPPKGCFWGSPGESVEPQQNMAASSIFDSLAEGEQGMDILQAFEEDILRSRMSPGGFGRAYPQAKGVMHSERRVSPRESVGSERSLSLTLGDNFSLPHAWEPKAINDGMSHGAGLASGHASFDALSQTTSYRGNLQRAHSAQEIAHNRLPYLPVPQDIPHIKIKAEDLDLGKDCLELDPLLLDHIHLTADSLGLGSERQQGLLPPQLQAAQLAHQHIIKDEFPGPAADFLPAAVPPVVTAANLTRGRGWNRRRSLQRAFDMAAEPPSPMALRSSNGLCRELFGRSPPHVKQEADLDAQLLMGSSMPALPPTCPSSLPKSLKQEPGDSRSGQGRSRRQASCNQEPDYEPPQQRKRKTRCHPQATFCGIASPFSIMKASPLEDATSSTSLSELNTKVEAFAKKHGDSGGGGHMRKRTRNGPASQEAGSSAQASPSHGGPGMETASSLERRNTAPALMLSSLAEAIQGGPLQQPPCAWSALGAQPNFQQVAKNVRVQRHGRA